MYVFGSVLATRTLNIDTKCLMMPGKTSSRLKSLLSSFQYICVEKRAQQQCNTAREQCFESIFFTLWTFLHSGNKSRGPFISGEYYTLLYSILNPSTDLSHSFFPPNLFSFNFDFGFILCQSNPRRSVKICHQIWTNNKTLCTYFQLSPCI